MSVSLVGLREHLRLAALAVTAAVAMYLVARACGVDVPLPGAPWAASERPSNVVAYAAPPRGSTATRVWPGRARVAAIPAPRRTPASTRSASRNAPRPEPDHLTIARSTPPAEPARPPDLRGAPPSTSAPPPTSASESPLPEPAELSSPQLPPPLEPPALPSPLPESSPSLEPLPVPTTVAPPALAELVALPKP